MKIKKIFAALAAAAVSAVSFASMTFSTASAADVVAIAGLRGQAGTYNYWKPESCSSNITVKDAEIDGNAQYEFKDKDTYESFVKDYYEEVKEDSRLEIESSGQYSYYNPDITEIIVAVTPEAYEELGEEALKKEALEVGEAAMKFQMNTKNPKGELTVIYRDANTSEVYFEIKVEA